MSFDFRRDSKKDSGVVRKTAINTPQRPGSLDVKALQVDVFPYDAFEFDDPDKTANPRVKLRDPWVWEVESEINALDQKVVTNAVKLAISTTSVVYNRSLIPTPTNLLLEGLHDDGSAYAGRFKIVLIYDEDSEITAYTSSADEATKSYAIPVTVEVAGTVYRVNNIVCNIYASGGTSKLLDTKSCSLNLNSSSTYYWGALTAAPSSDFILGDYYFDSNTSASGGGILRYWTGSAWAEMTSAHPMYIQAVWQALADMGAWATEQDEVIAAASAIFKRLVTANAFIANLFAQQITVPDGGRIRYETGAGVQKRCVQLADEKIDWLDIPDTTPASPEVLRARIGRLGVGGDILLDGDFLTAIESSWGAAVTVSSAAAYTPVAIQTADGTLRIAYQRASGADIVERIWNGVSWGSELTISGVSATSPSYVQRNDGELRIAYVVTSGSVLVERIWDGSSWGSQSVIDSNTSYTPSYTELSSGALKIVYRNSSNYIVERTWSGASWGDATSINEASSYFPHYLEMSDGSIRICYIRSSDGHVVERLLTNGIWSSETDISLTTTGRPRYIEDIKGKLRISYSAASNLVERIWDGSAWGAASIIASDYSSTPYYYQTQNGSLKLVYTLSSSIVERTLQRYARIGAGIIESGYVSGRGWYVKFGDGTMEQWGKVTGLTFNTGLVGYIYYFPAAFSDGVNKVVTYSVSPGSSWNFTLKGSDLLDYVDRHNVAIEASSVCTGMCIMWRAIGRWRA